MQKPSMIDFPSNRARKKVSRWYCRKQKLAAAEKLLRVALCWFGDLQKWNQIKGSCMGLTSSGGAPHYQGKAQQQHWFLASSSAGDRATDKALQLMCSSRVCLPALLLYLLSSSAFNTSATAKCFGSSVFVSSAKERNYYIFSYLFLLRICDVFVQVLYSILIIS